MDKTVTVTLRNGRQVTYAFPYSPFMEAVCNSVFNGREYPSMPFLDMRTIIDVGANIGCSALLFAALYPSAIIYALEPATEAFNYLQRNTAHVPAIRRFKFGLFDRDATTLLHLGSQASVTNSLAPNSMTSAAREQITLRRCSSFLAEQAISRISLLKIDTEGAEFPILADLAPHFDRIDAIMLEYHSESDRLAIDRLLEAKFTLFNSDSIFPHRGSNTYVAKSLLGSCTQWNSIIIQRPAL